MSQIEKVHERYYWLALGLVEGLSLSWRTKLLRIFGHPKEVFVWAQNPYKTPENLPGNLAEAIKSFSFALLEDELREIERQGGRLFTYEDDDYPQGLRELWDAPLFLIARGKFAFTELENAHTLAVVGARQASAYGTMVTQSLVTPLAKLGYIIVSGGARGIDATAHESVLKADGTTVAVLGSGIGCPYPTEHKGLFRKIESRGAVVSEFPCLNAPRAYHFPQRNRIIAALAKGVLVTEAGAKSGSLITARMALEMGRELMVVPGPIHEGNYRGSHQLLKNGAHVVTASEDVASILGDARKWPQKEINPTVSQKALLMMMGSAVLSREQMFQRAGMSDTQFLGELAELKQNGWICALTGDRFMRTLEGSEKSWQNQ